MPFVKYPRATEPLWHEWDRKAQKCGLRHTIYAVNGDQYTGEWLDNLKHGKIDHFEKKYQFTCLYKSLQGQGAVSGCRCSWKTVHSRMTVYIYMFLICVMQKCAQVYF